MAILIVNEYEVLLTCCWAGWLVEWRASVGRNSLGFAHLNSVATALAKRRRPLATSGNGGTLALLTVGTIF